MRVALVALIALLLAACGTSPQRATSSSTTEIARPAPATSRGGGYYKDDGPGDNPPADIASIPDAEPKAEPLLKFANKPYVALGQSYTPATEVKPFKQRGLASWYGRRFHGKRTSSGETYDMYAMTAAHPTLPIPSYARITNLDNGKSVVVRINDRGPFHSKRVIDLSYTAAAKLGYIGTGHTQVEVEAVVPTDEMIAANRRRDASPAAIAPAVASAAGPAVTEKSAPPVAAAASSAAAQASAADDPIAQLAAQRNAESEAAPAAATDKSDNEPSGIFVQLGAWRSLDMAENLRGRVRREFATVTERLLISVQSGMYRLHLGPYASTDDARAMAARIGAALKLRPVVIQR